MKEFNNDKDIFNNSLKKKFGESKVQPSSAVWEGIEAELLKQDNVKMRRKAIFYRNVAAAVLLLMAVSLYFNLQGVRNTIKPVQIEITDLSNSTLKRSNNSSDVLSANDLPQVANNKKEHKQSLQENSKTKVNSNEGNSNVAEDRDVKASSFEQNTAGREGEGSAFALAANERGENSSSVFEESLIGINELNEADFDKLAARMPVNNEFSEVYLADVKVEEVSYFAVSEVKKEKKSNDIGFQSSFNIGSGSFNPNSNITSSPVSSNFSTLNTPGSAGRSLGGDVSQNFSQEKAVVDDLSSAPIRSNISLTFGVHAGVNINERWKIRSGLQFGNYRTSSESSTVIRDMNSEQFFPYHGASSATELSEGKIINVTSEYDFYNDFQILSVPLIVSYKFIDRKFGMALVSGATADLLLKNTIRGGSDQISDINFDKNDKQSYKKVFYSGLAGLEFSYSFSKHYAISLTPTYKKALMNITNDNATFNSSPDFISLDMSIQYLF
ncbi:hypothetical protein GCM10011506_13460 [Marivirga lumbricoides]|uniref:Outer membrane protein beta-barrel domain-containing protein n=1 Tax=Marivirga lumbricoides TaxID=1046115 RepID=A0ABQ1LSI4_9BACT|nr:hypothetical protein GCM10011506_13460 [Marivirga lumbricoides]